MINIWHGCYDNNNFGDHIGKYIINKLTGIQPTFIHPAIDVSDVYVYSGSVLREAKSNWHCFGLGFGEADQVCPVAPKKIYSVRGKYSREILLKQGIDCPEIYTDICEYLPSFYFPKIEQKYEIGFIPHYLDYDEYMAYNGGNTTVINICDAPENIIKQMLRCKKIISTSLHGLILSDVYGVPNQWEKSKREVSEFKFYDYLSKFIQ